MPEPRKRSRTLRRVKRKLPGSKTAMHYKLKKPSAHKCGVCGNVLKGTVRERPGKLKNVPKNQRRPDRPYGGVLCSKCSRSVIRAQARSEKK